MSPCRIITKREFESLHWLAKGKTYDEIAVILQIKERTVRFRLQALKEKTGCMTLFQLGSFYQQKVDYIKQTIAVG